MGKREVTVWNEVFPGVLSRIEAAEIRVRLDLSDATVIDVDECLVDGFTQVRLAREIARLLARSCPLHPGRLLILGRLIRARKALARVNRQELPVEEKNLRRQELFANACRGTPRKIMEQALDAAWAGLRPGAAVCVRYLAECHPTGVISFGLDLVLDHLPRVLQRETRRAVPLNFLEANAAVWSGGKFEGLRRPIQRSAKDKRSAFERATKPLAACAPLVIGHGPDEAQLCELAHEMGGLSVGVAAREADRPQFHTVIPDGSWVTLLRFLVRYRPENTGSIN